MSQNLSKSCVFPGRFQPFHNGHAAGVLHAASIYDYVVVAISNAHISHTSNDPFTGGERFEMIDAWARDMAIREKLKIIPVPVDDDPTSWVATIRTISPTFQDVYTRSAWTESLFAYWGFANCKTLFEGHHLSASEVRASIAELTGSWRALVPVSTAAVISACGGEARVSGLLAGRNHRLATSTGPQENRGANDAQQPYQRSQ